MAQSAGQGQKKDSEVENDANELKDGLDELDEVLEIANENGLLKGEPEKYNEIVGDIANARENLSGDQPKMNEACKNFSIAYFKFNEAINSKGGWWRFKYSFGGPVLVYLLAILVSVFLAWFLFSPVFMSSTILWVPSWAFIWGLMGGILKGFWTLWQHVSDRDFRRGWFVWYLVLPLMGVLFGALTYLVYFAGFIVATGATKLSSELFVILLCALAGFSSEWIVGLLGNLTDMIHVGSGSA